MPLITDYNRAIQIHQGKAFKKLKDAFFIANSVFSGNSFFQIYQYGVGAFAAVFKAKIDNKQYAVRCFLSPDKQIEERYLGLQRYFEKIKPEWFVNFEYMNNEMTIEDQNYPIVKMDWVDGKPINQYVIENIRNLSKLSLLQELLVDLGKSLERYSTVHGDLQAGNIFVEEKGAQVNLKLIDYDNVHIPSAHEFESIEDGKPEYQHPLRRNIRGRLFFQIDAFSIWVMLTAIEATKNDPKLWNREYNAGRASGYNNLENFLFKNTDFIDSDASPLFQLLERINSLPLQFYVKQLKKFCKSSIHDIMRPTLFGGELSRYPIQPETEIGPFTLDEIRILSIPSGAVVMHSNFQILGETTLTLDMANFLGQTLYITHPNHSAPKPIIISKDVKEYMVKF